MNTLRKAIYSVMLVSMVGCSIFSSDGSRIDYGANSKRVPMLDVPPDLTMPSVDDRYKVPQGNDASASYSDYSKGSSAQGNVSAVVLPIIQTVRLERYGAQRWLVVDDKPENVWPIVKAFWQEIGLTILSEDQAAGAMETDWAENRAKIPQSSVRKMLGKVFSNLYSSGERDQYLTRLERGKDGNTTAVYVTYRGKVEVFSADKTSSRWQDRPVDPEIEAIMLQRLMVRLGATELQATASVQGAQGVAVQATQLQGAVSLREISGGKTVIVIGETFDRTWRKVGLAIEESSLTLEDKDREKGIYFLQLPQAKKGLIDKLKFWSDSEEANKRYRVSVTDGGESCEVSVADQDGVQSKTAKQVVELLYKNLEKK